jgi:hypothetical protein
VLVGIHEPSRPDDLVPPATPPVRLGDAPGAVRVPGERVNDEYGILARRVQFAPGLVGERDLL